MTPQPTGHLVRGVHVIGADVDDATLALMAQHRYTCARCGWSVVADNAAVMRRLAQAHHGIVRPLPVYRHRGEVPVTDSRQDGTR